MLVTDFEILDQILERISTDRYDPSLDGNDHRAHAPQHEQHAAYPAFLGEGRRLAKAIPVTAPRGAPGKPAMRRELRNLALYFWANRHLIDYSQARPTYGIHPFILPKQLKAHGRWRWDCSGGAAYLYRAATRGKVDPNGNGFSGFGYTGTLIAHGHRVVVPKIGDLVFYKNSDGVVSHVAVFVEKGLDGRVWSMGSSPGPLILPNDYRPVFTVRRYI